MSKKLFTYLIIMLLIIPFLGINFILGFIGNLFLLMFLFPLLIIIVALLRFNSIKSDSQTCSNCGLIIIGNSTQCIYCGENLVKNQFNKNLNNLANESIIEVDAEEIK